MSNTVPSVPERDRRVPLIVAGSLLAGFVAAIVLVVGPMAGGTEPRITGSVLLAFGLGWGLIAVLSTRYTDQPQRWALVPAAYMGIVGLSLIVLQPGQGVMDALSWVWPPVLLVLAG